MTQTPFLPGLRLACAFLLTLVCSSGSVAFASWQDQHGENEPPQTEKHNMDRVTTTEHGADTHQQGDPAHADDHADEALHGDGPADEHDGHGDGHAMDLGQQQAAKIAVTEPPVWFGGVIWGAGLLFLLAATLGSVAIIVKGPEPPDPADAHGHGEDHGHH